MEYQFRLYVASQSDVCALMQPDSLISVLYCLSSGLIVSQLDSAVQRFFNAGLTASSHKTYQAAERRYMNFCINFALQPLPMSEVTLCYFVACLGQQGLSDSSIRTYLSGIRQLHISNHLPDPNISNMPRLHQILRGIKILRSMDGQPPHTHPPITPLILRRMKPLDFRQPYL